MWEESDHELFMNHHFRSQKWKKRGRGKAHIRPIGGSARERADEHASSPSAMEKERQRKKLDQSLSGERFNEDDLIRSAAELYGRLSGFSRQSLAASQVARIVGNCFRNPAQMRSRSRHRRVAVNARCAFRSVCARAKETAGVEWRERRSWCVNHSAQLRQLPDRSQVSTYYPRTRPLRRFPRPLPFTLRANLARAPFRTSNASAGIADAIR